MKLINLNRSVIRISGATADKFLQGIITNDINNIEHGCGIYSYILTPQGKYLFDFFVVSQAPDFLIDIDKNDKEDLLKKLQIYKLRSQVEISELPEMQVYSSFQQVDGICFLDPRSDKMGYRFITNKTFDSLEYTEYQKLRIENNLPEGTDLEKDKSYPLQYRMKELNGVSFKKGCFVGQEVTARTHHRGVIRKTVYQVAGQNLQAGAEILADENMVGKILTAVENSALAIIEIEVVEQKKQLTSGGNVIKIIT